MTTTHDLTDFRAYIDNLLTGRRYRRIQYFTCLHELITVDALMQEIVLENDGEIVTLSTGNRIPLNRIVSVGGRFSPVYAGYELYCETCDC